MNDLLVPPPIPFADVTVGELEEAAAIFGTSTAEQVRSVENGPDNARRNPDLVYDRFFVPTGNLLVRFRNLEAAGSGAATGVDIPAILKALGELEQAVIDENGKEITESGLPGGTVYRRSIEKIRYWLGDPIGRKPPFPIFGKGNTKLPFWTWSTLPGVTCPGAGACLKSVDKPGKRGWCYSFAAWRHVTPWFRQLQNTILMRLPDKSWIEKDARAKFRAGQTVRLYVDGDIDSMATLTYWMHFCERFPEVSFYGYSKSWQLFQQWHKLHNGRWPANYQLNLSSGTKLEAVLSPEKFKAYVASMLDLRHPTTGKHLVRGTFRALEVASEPPKMSKTEEKRGKFLTPSKIAGMSSHRKEVLAKAVELGITGDSTGKGVFVCPGYCGNCLPRGRHACGDRAFRGVAIVIGIH